MKRHNESFHADRFAACELIVKTLALRMIADWIDPGETIPELDELFTVPA